MRYCCAHVPEIGFRNGQVENKRFPRGIEWFSLRSVLQHKSKFNHKQRFFSPVWQPRLYSVYNAHFTPLTFLLRLLLPSPCSHGHLFICLKGSLFSICRGKINLSLRWLQAQILEEVYYLFCQVDSPSRLNCINTSFIANQVDESYILKPVKIIEETSVRKQYSYTLISYSRSSNWF